MRRRLPLRDVFLGAFALLLVLAVAHRAETVAGWHQNAAKHHRAVHAQQQVRKAHQWPPRTV